MPKCKICNKPVTSGVVVDVECLENMVEVVRCKDCKLYTDNINDDNLRNGYCTRLKNFYFDIREADDYCSNGEKSVKK